ncbi:uncharacterized protein psda isoform X2 [Brachyhypopomus gauderio]|uniref:uncharacterized protein psda isoform X2 n=1 Tax=Brachyhypopomus gauderio TaxID=698409 RepID=UPI0040433C94
MAQSSKVLHLYVEVRSLADQGKTLENTEGTNSLMLPRPDILSQSQSATLNAPLGLVHLPGDVHKEASNTHTFPSSKSPPRHSVSFQPNPEEAIVQLPAQSRQSLPYDEISQLLSALKSGPGVGTLVRRQSSESEPFQKRDCRIPGHFTAPPTPSGSRRTYGCEEEGKRSAVTYHYIEKANIKFVQGQHSGLCQSEPGNPFRRPMNDKDIPLHLSNIVSDPVGFNSWGSSDTINIKHTIPGLVRTQRDIPILQRATVKSIAREATNRALDEFGSPQLKRRWAANIAGRGHDPIRKDQPCCNSWSGSPVVPHSARTLPINAQLTDQNQYKTSYGIPRSQVSDQLSSHTRQPSCDQSVDQRTSKSPYQTHKVNFNLANSSSASDGVVGKQSSCKSRLPDITPEMAHKLAEEAAKLSRLMEARRTSSPTPSLPDTVRTDCWPRESQFYASFQGPSAKTDSNFPAEVYHSEEQPVQKGHLSGQASPISFHRGSLSPAHAGKLHHVSTSPIPDLQQERSELPGKESPVLYQHRTPQYTGNHHSPRAEHRHCDAQYSTVLGDSPESSRRVFPELLTDTPLSSSFQHQSWHEERSFRATDVNKEHLYSAGSPSGTSPWEFSNQGRSSAAVLGPQRNHCRVPDDREMRGEGVADVEHSAVLSQSSSGVTGSLRESIQPETDCISPETSSQTSQRSSDTGTTGTQLDSGSPLLRASLHSQKIARAKWEFLFGKPSEDHHVIKDVPGSSTAPSSGYSSEFPTPSPSSSLPPRSAAAYSSHRPLSESQKSSNHDVQEVEVELVGPAPPSVLGSSPTTGIIRRTIRYSETDLDAVPLRCYRETDIDEVLLAEQEEDSAFSSNHSMPGTSGTSGSSPPEATWWSQGDGVEEDEELLQDEDVASWASVRMQCDRKKQHALHDGDEVFTQLLRRPSRTSMDGLDSFSRHFENIMESHRAKGTSYSSLDSEDMTPSGPAVFTFDLPTLTPEIQSQIRESTTQIIELSFAPLALPDVPGLSVSAGPEAPQGSASTDPKGTDKEENESCGTPPKNLLRPDAGTEADQRERSSRPASLSDLDVTITNGNKGDLQAAKRLAKRLHNLDGFRRSDVMRHLSKNNEFSQMVAEEYLSHFNFSGLSVDQSLRVFLREFALTGETQERERVLSHFSRRYLQCNPNTIPDEDSIHTLTCALMLLNTDLHGHSVGKRMSCRQFISNLEGLNGGQDFPRELLRALYNSIKNEKLQWTIDEEELRKSFSELTTSRTDSASHTLKRSGSGAWPLSSLAQQASAQVYKNGFLVRKVHADPDGKKTPRGRRGWKTFYAILKGLVLYLQKGEYRADKQLSDEDLKNAVSIHHSLALRAADYSKRPNVFYLRTADWRVFLFQAPNAEQMQSWITRINTVAALFSAPPFPPAIGSQKRFSRPLLPGSSTKLSQEEQVQSHETRFRAVSSELQELRSVPQERKLRGRELEEAKLREEYLEFEKTRYGTYAMLLRAKIRSGETDVAAFEARLFADGGLQRAHSSPTLPQDSSHASAGKKGRPSEGHRHDHRQALKP